MIRAPKKLYLGFDTLGDLLRHVLCAQCVCCIALQTLLSHLCQHYVSDKRVTRNITLISALMLGISAIFASADGRAGERLFYVNLFITIDLLVSSYLIVRYLLKLEPEKNIMMKKSYRKQS